MMTVKKYIVPKIEGETFQERKARIVPAMTFSGDKAYSELNDRVFIDGTMTGFTEEAMTQEEIDAYAI